MLVARGKTKQESRIVFRGPGLGPCHSEAMNSAPKLEAFAGRGKGDYQSSNDVEDLLAVVNGRGELAEEIRARPE